MRMNPTKRFSAHLADGCDPGPVIVGSLEFARELLANTSLDERARVKAMVVIEELVSNCLRHGGASGDISMQLLLSEVSGALQVTLEDTGPVFDPTEADRTPGPDPETGGSVGLAIVRNWSEGLSYSRKGAINRVTLAIR